MTSQTSFPPLYPHLLLPPPWHRTKAWMISSIQHDYRELLKLVSICLLFMSMALYLVSYYVRGSGKSNLPVINRWFVWEPHILSRIRWAFFSVRILDNANEKYRGGPYILARGDADFIVLPPQFISELNRLPQTTVSSRKSHASSLTGHLNGMDVVVKSNHHVKMLLNRITPALPELLPHASKRIQDALVQLFPQQTECWTTVEPLDKIVHCVSQAVTLTTFGAPICDSPKLIRLCYEHTKNIFSIMFVMRLVPSFLQTTLVWTLPFKWRLLKSWETLESFVIPEAQRRKAENDHPETPNLISWMIKDAKTEEETDPWMLTRLVGSVVAGGTYSSAAFIEGVIMDLVAHPEALKEIRDEIRETHQRVGGRWDEAAFNSLDKLDSAMKETTRLAPGSLLVYSRQMQEDHVLSDGTLLLKGQFITVSGHSRAMDPVMFSNPREYNALRSYNRGLDDHRAKPFKSIDGEDYRWGAGRWACPGRFIANIVSKVILVKLFDEYDFQFIDGRRPVNSVLHEFVFFRPETKIMMRRRDNNLGITY